MPYQSDIAAVECCLFYWCEQEQLWWCCCKHSSITLQSTIFPTWWSGVQ